MFVVYVTCIRIQITHIGYLRWQRSRW